jgi:Spy/CpxP family protein refolding chaperone
MTGNVVRLATATAAIALVSIAAGQPRPLPQQYSTQNARSEGAVSAGIDRLTVLTRLLALTTNQQDQTKAIFDGEEAARKPLVEELQQASDALASAEKTAATDSDIEQLAANMTTTLSQLLADDAKAQSKIYAQLTAEQQQKLDQLPHPLFVPFAPLLPPGPLVLSAASGDH